MIISKMGDLFDSKCQIKCHQVNCQGVMGSGIAKTVRERYSNVFDQYLTLCNEKIRGGNSSMLLNTVQLIEIGGGTYIANLFSQDNFGSSGRYTSYDAFDECVKQISETGMSVAFPYNIGCDRGGGDWNIVFSIIKKYFEESSTVCEIIRLPQ